MKASPFTSKTYQKTWLKYFAKKQIVKKFEFIKNLSFIKHPFLPYYINAGRNMTNGITYEIDYLQQDFKNKTIVIYDVPDYCDDSKSPKKSSLKVRKVRQYKGFLADLKGVSSFNDYIQNTLNSKSRNKFRSTLKKFESCFDVDYKFYYGKTDLGAYEIMMVGFKKLLEIRYGDLKIETNLSHEWPFYQELVYNMLREKKAMIISIEVSGKPISMSLAFVGENTLVGAVKAFNADFYKFNVGHIEISKFIEWSIKNNIQTLDFSKGEYEYKTKWTNTNYLYNCHILYDASSISSRLNGCLLIKYFELKQYLRDKNFNLFVAKLRFAIKKLGSKNSQQLSYKILELKDDFNMNEFEITSLDKEEGSYPFLKRIVFDGLYQKPEELIGVELYKSIDKTDNKMRFLVYGNKHKYFIAIL
ncbi:GNAT family N-acetyltransferase [Bizionia argentinensis JUB59]|uniref:GNAT family N-acetyltransferase n=1 Tax=Bizionia argentinensis JUB59 TaxID=1046627 RepID=G2E9A5_9FLAO|nr:GNAT family N-acetyltransferase [Bizionia argentinensis]EGV45014.1 GNAT family N-acetyltransferase [Bizionia argentinensis JUB59]